MHPKFLGTTLLLSVATMLFTSSAQAQYVPPRPPEASPPQPNPQQPPPPPEAQPQPGYQGQPQQSVPAQAQQGYPAQSQQGYPAQAQQGYSAQPQQGYPTQPQPGYPPAPYGYQPAPGMSPYAQPILGAPPGYHSHDGFFFRGTLGFGRGSSKFDGANRGGDSAYSGFGGALHLAFGGAIAENLIIYGEFGVFTLPGPNVREGDENLGKASDDFAVTTQEIGGGVAYYFMPVNVYMSASVMLTKLEISYDDDVLGESDPGVGLSFKVGKEWWVSQDWGLGGYVGFEHAVMKHQRQDDGLEDDATWTTTGFTLGFSATYN